MNPAHRRLVLLSMARVTGLAVVVALGWVALVGARSQPPARDLKALLDLYDRGQFDEAVGHAAAIGDLGPLRLRYVQDTPGWIDSDPARSARRRAVTAAFLLELTHARLESDWGRLSDLVEWTCARLRTAGPPSAFELSWHRASMAVAGRARARLWLLGEVPRLPHQPVRTRLPPGAKPDNPSPVHLMHALERYPQDPELRLGQVLAWTWGRDAEPTRNTGSRDREEARIINPALPGSIRTIARRAPQLEAVVALEPLLSDAAVGAEAHVRTGIVHFTVSDYTSALRAFESAQALATDVTMRYLSAFYAGRTLEALNRVDEAIGQYEKALAAIPSAESAIVALSSLHFVRDNRETALALVDRAFAAHATDTDPGRLTGYGSFMRWPALKAAMRAELPQ